MAENEDTRKTMKMTLVLRGPVMLSKMIEEGMAWRLADEIEKGIHEALNRWGPTAEEIHVWDVSVDYASERTLTDEERKQEERS